MSLFAIPMRFLHSEFLRDLVKNHSRSLFTDNTLISPKTAKEKFGLAWIGLAPGLEKFGARLGLAWRPAWKKVQEFWRCSSSNAWVALRAPPPGRDAPRSVGARRLRSCADKIHLGS